MLKKKKCRPREKLTILLLTHKKKTKTNLRRKKKEKIVFGTQQFSLTYFTDVASSL